MKYNILRKYYLAIYRNSSIFLFKLKMCFKPDLLPLSYNFFEAVISYNGSHVFFILKIKFCQPILNTR